MRIGAWAPEGLTAQERTFLDKCPKSVLFVIARQLGAVAAGSCDNLDAGFNQLMNEWKAQHEVGNVPQKPIKLP